MRRLVLVIGMASLVLLIHTLTLPYRNTFSPLFPSFKIPTLEERSLPGKTTPKSMRVGKLSLLSDSQDSAISSTFPKEVETANISDTGGEETGHVSRIREISGDIVKDDDLSEDPNRELSFDLEDGIMSKKVGDPGSDFLIERVVEPKIIVSLETVGVVGNISTTATIAPPGKQAKEKLLGNEALMHLPSDSTSIVNSTGSSNPLVKKKKKVWPPMSISEMNRPLFRRRHRSMRPRWSLGSDKQILAAKAQIENAPIAKNERDLYAPLFQNISMFKRSYEVMERTLKVYVYKEGQKPIFHQPLLTGIYASEGWFMKLMEMNRQFLVKDPRKAHLFYMPFSSRYLQHALYVPNSHNMRNLEEYLKNYAAVLATKYPFWNRTGGADHFLVACHDWAPFETRHTMGLSIRALCNADLHNGFRVGKDVSLPETYVRSGRNPLRDLGGRPADMRPTLAFYAGNMHGSLRPILVRHWENKDPYMKIFGPMPSGVASKMTYIQHMKTSKYCICPRGYEVNSPRVVESIFYECVPVIISDDYVPPFFEVLDWEAFSVIIPEKDVPRLKEILESIPEEKYQALQMGVRKVQRHFLWNSKPVKYDLFHMILHSIWFSRLHQI